MIDRLVEITVYFIVRIIHMQVHVLLDNWCFNTYTAKPVCWSGWISDSYCSLKPLCSSMGEVVPARTSPTLLPHPLALYCHYPVSKCCSASIVVTGTVRVKLFNLCFVYLYNVCEYRFIFLFQHHVHNGLIESPTYAVKYMPLKMLNLSTCYKPAANLE